MSNARRCLVAVVFALCPLAVPGVAQAAWIDAAHVPLAGGPSSVAFDSNRGRLYVPAGTQSLLRALDAETRTVVGTVFVQRPGPVAVNPTTGRVYVAGVTASGVPAVTVVNGPTMSVVATKSLPGEASSIAVNPATNRVYIAQPAVKRVTVLDGTTNGFLTHLSFSDTPRGVAANASSNRLYVAAGPRVWVIHGSTHGLITVVSLPAPAEANAVSWNPVTNRVYATQLGSPGRLTAFDGASHSILASTLHGSHLSGVAVDPSRNLVLTVGVGNNMLLVSDGTSLAMRGSVFVPGPTGVAANPMSREVYVSSSFDELTVAVDDVVPPETFFIDASPVTTGPDVTFAFAGTDDHSTAAQLSFSCRLDAGPTGPCTSPRSHAGLSPGTHTFHVWARDRAGNQDPTAATFTWTVDTAPPSTMIGTADPSLLVRQLGDEVTGTVTDDVAGVASVTVTFSDVVFGGSTTVAATLSCGPGALSCTWSAAPPGSGMFDVKATSVDAVGNAEDPGAGPVRVLVA